MSEYCPNCSRSQRSAKVQDTPLGELLKCSCGYAWTTRPLRMQETIRETNKFRLYVLNARTYLQSKVGGRPATVRVRRNDFAYLQSLSDPSFNASACLEFGCGLYQ